MNRRTLLGRLAALAGAAVAPAATAEAATDPMQEMVLLQRQRDFWIEDARRYAADADYWRERAADARAEGYRRGYDVATARAESRAAAVPVTTTVRHDDFVGEMISDVLAGFSCPYGCRIDRHFSVLDLAHRVYVYDQDGEIRAHGLLERIREGGDFDALRTMVQQLSHADARLHEQEADDPLRVSSSSRSTL